MWLNMLYNEIHKTVPVAEIMAGTMEDMIRLLRYGDAQIGHPLLLDPTVHYYLLVSFDYLFSCQHR